ncbi:UNVERIFIED_CONTAM: hypothetical protein HDU68_003401 [Siphonaria sp. JEL0065]|nr:hypothetical protein HDU68_003401 [Siphonaria sp. JEL0065]
MSVSLAGPSQTQAPTQAPTQTQTPTQLVHTFLEGRKPPVSHTLVNAGVELKTVPDAKQGWKLEVSAPNRALSPQELEDQTQILKACDKLNAIARVSIISSNTAVLDGPLTSPMPSSSAVTVQDLTNRKLTYSALEQNCTLTQSPTLCPEAEWTMKSLGALAPTKGDIIVSNKCGELIDKLEDQTPITKQEKKANQSLINVMGSYQKLVNNTTDEAHVDYLHDEMLNGLGMSQHQGWSTLTKPNLHVSETAVAKADIVKIHFNADQKVDGLFIVESKNPSISMIMGDKVEKELAQPQLDLHVIGTIVDMYTETGQTAELAFRVARGDFDTILNDPIPISGVVGNSRRMEGQIRSTTLADVVCIVNGYSALTANEATRINLSEVSNAAGQTCDKNLSKLQTTYANLAKTTQAEIDQIGTRSLGIKESMLYRRAHRTEFQGGISHVSSQFTRPAPGPILPPGSTTAQAPDHSKKGTKRKAAPI